MPQWYTHSFPNSLEERRLKRLEQMRRRMIDNALREEREAKASKSKAKKAKLRNG